MSIKTGQAILKCFIDLKSSVWFVLDSRRELTRGDFFRRFSTEAAWKVKMLWHQTSPVTPCFGQKIVTNIQRLETNKTWYRNLTKPAGLIRITTYDSSKQLNFFDLWNLLRIWDCRPFSVLKTLTGSQAEKSSKCHKTRFCLLSPAQTKH